VIPPELADLSSSAKLVYRCLHEEGALRPSEIVGELYLSENTVRSALDDLREADVVIERPVASDARRRQYVLVETLEDAPEDPPAQRHLGHLVHTRS
jgi:DNA-binding MarR family transcriptional regulator